MIREWRDAAIAGDADSEDKYGQTALMLAAMGVSRDRPLRLISPWGMFPGNTFC